MPLSKAQQNKNYLEKLKATSKYEDHKKKKAEQARAYRLKKKEAEYEMPLTERVVSNQQRRQETLKSVRKCRANKRGQKENTHDESESNASSQLNSSLDDITSTAYTTVQSLGKAKSKVMRALPISPTKRKAVLAHILSEMADGDKIDVANAVVTPPPLTKKHTETKRDLTTLKREIKEFYERDDVSRVSPKIRDVKEYVCPDTGNKILLPTRHMLYTGREAFALFDEQQREIGHGIELFCKLLRILYLRTIIYINCILPINLETCGITFFQNQRPKHVKPIGDLPHDVCLCSYHQNFIYTVEALHKYVPGIPSYQDDFLGYFLCEVSSMECWYGRCDKCTGVTIPKLVALGNEIDFAMPVSWNVWKKNLHDNRTEKHVENKTMADLIAHTVALSPQFLIHNFNKREQSDTFNMHDRPRAANVEYALEGLLQIDFAENFVCVNQDEVQNAHWNQQQLTLFTSGLYYNDVFQPKVFVSDNKSHTKETIVPYLWKLISNMRYPVTKSGKLNLGN